MRKFIFSRRNLFQLGVVILLLLLAVLMFIVGKMHTVLLDNKTIEADGITYAAFSVVEVEVNKKGLLELAARDRDMAEVMGQRHKISVIYTDKNFEEHKIVKKFKVPLGDDMVLISIPALVGGADQEIWLQKFIAPTASVAPQAEPVDLIDDLTSLDIEF
jgi:hypothetical protein